MSKVEFFKGCNYFLKLQIGKCYYKNNFLFKIIFYLNICSHTSHASNFQVYIWVLNEEQEYKRAFDLGATGVMTDYPTKLKNFLHSFSA